MRLKSRSPRLTLPYETLPNNLKTPTFDWTAAAAFAFSCLLVLTTSCAHFFMAAAKSDLFAEEIGIPALIARITSL